MGFPYSLKQGVWTAIIIFADQQICQAEFVWLCEKEADQLSGQCYGFNSRLNALGLLLTISPNLCEIPGSSWRNCQPLSNPPKRVQAGRALLKGLERWESLMYKLMPVFLETDMSSETLLGSHPSFVEITRQRKNHHAKL